MVEMTAASLWLLISGLRSSCVGPYHRAGEPEFVHPLAEEICADIEPTEASGPVLSDILVIVGAVIVLRS